MKSWLKILIALFLLGVIAATFVYFFIYNKPHKDYLKAKPEVFVTAAELYDAFINDPDGSQQFYNGKVLQIEGRIDDIESSGEMLIIVFIFEDGAFGPEGVRCTMLPEFNEEARGKQIGDYVTLKGLCTGYLGDVILEKCSFVE